MARDPKTSFKFFTVSPLTASADRTSVLYAQPASSAATNVIVSDPFSQFTETLGDATRFGAQTDVAGPNGAALIQGFNGQNQLMFLKMVVRNAALAGTGLTSLTFQVIGDSQPAVTFTAASATISGTFAAAFQVGTPVQFVSSAQLPAEIVQNQIYYVVTSSTSALTVSATAGGTAIIMGSTGSAAPAVHSVVQVGVSVVAANADTLAKRTLSNFAAITPAVAMSVAANGSTFKFVPLLTNNRTLQLIVAASAVSGSGAGSFEIRQAAMVNGREGSMGVSF